MRIIHAESFEEVSTKDLDNVRDLLKRYKTLKLSAGISATSAKQPKKPSKAIN